MEISLLKIRPAGYGYLLKKWEVSAIAHWHSSFVSATGMHRSNIKNGAIEDIA